MRPLVARAALRALARLRARGARALELAGLAPGDRRAASSTAASRRRCAIQLRELGTRAPSRCRRGPAAWPSRGGPLNNFVLQAAARMVALLREQGGAALLTAVSGMLTKQGVSLWSCEPGAAGFGYADVSAEAERAEAPRTVADGARRGRGRGLHGGLRGGRAAPHASRSSIATTARARSRRATTPELARRGRRERARRDARVRVAADGRVRRLACASARLVS